MLKVLAALRRHAMDVLTGAFLVLAVYLLMQPGSLLRVAWARHRAEVATSKMLARKWDEIAKISSPLSRDSGRVQVVEIADFECPFCRKTRAAVDSVVARGLHVSYLNLPLAVHPQAEGAAIASLCAERSGRFREMYAQLMTSAEWQRDSNWARQAKLAGVPDLQQFEECLRSPMARQRLTQQQALAESLQVNATPTFVSRNGVHHGVASAEQLLDLSSEK